MVILGYDNINFSFNINEERQRYNNYNGNYPLDSDTIDDILEELAPSCLDRPYYSFRTKLSMHGPYIVQENWPKFIDLGYVDKFHQAEELGLYENPCLADPENVQAQIEMIMCETMDFDVAVGKLLNHQEETNQMDNTLLVLYGDHDTYFSIGIDRPLKEYVYNCEDETFLDQYQTMLFMYNKNLTKKYAKFKQKVGN
jgi:phosphoglycerol transferase MdoB-like AlkP superfamily enzyme